VARPYDFRHSFGTWLALETDGQERVVQTMMMHATAEQSRRYTEAATTPLVDQAIGRLRRATSVQPFARSQPLSSVVKGKPRRANRL
jgi:integrase